MYSVNRSARCFVLMCLALALPAVGAQTFAVPNADGWHSWQAMASDNGLGACCFRWQRGVTEQTTCDLDGNHSGLFTNSDCVDTSEQIRVYVLMNSGNPKKIRAYAASCRVTSQTDIVDLGQIDTVSSIAWLDRQARAKSRVSSDAVAAIATHGGRTVISTLIGLLESRAENMRIRKEALFWLAQSNTEEAFDYLDQLLGE